MADRMPRKIIKKYMPDQNKLREHKHLRWLGDHLHNPGLWHLSRRSTARAFMVGIFCAFLPIPGQMIVAAILALWIGANLPVSVGLVWLTNPVTIPPVFYATYKLGAWILGTPPVEIAWNLASIQHELATIWWPLLFGSLLAGCVFAALAYTLVTRLWIWHVNASRRKRASKRDHQG